MPLSTDIKTEIRNLLESLTKNETLREVIVDDFKMGIFDRDYGRFPVAIITTPSIEGEYFTDHQNMRIHTFEIVVLQKGENITSADEIETLVETILDKFDTNETLAGKAMQVEPASTVPQAVTSRGKNYVAFSVLIKAKAVKALA